MRHNVTPWSCACLVLTLAQAGGAPTVDGFYLGTFTRGNRTLEVGVTLTADSNALTGMYFYFGPSEGEIELAGALGVGQTIRLNETLDGRVTGRWEGKLVGGGLEGVWTNAGNGQQWTFRLRRAEQAAQFDGPASTLETGSGPIAFRTAKVPASEHLVPLVTEFHNPRVMTGINSSLMAAADNARCSPDVPDDFSFEAAVSFAGADVLSVRIVESWFCQAAYPNSDDRSMVFDLRTGNSLHLDDLLQKDVPPERMFAVLFPYELSRTQPGAPPSAWDDDRYCHDEWTPKALEEHGLNPGFHLTDEGLVVQLELPHVIAACANEVTVPYSALAPIAAPDGPLARLAKAHDGKPIRYRIHRPGMDPKENIFFTPSGKLPPIDFPP